jgi:hypothetical protein
LLTTTNAMPGVYLPDKTLLPASVQAVYKSI